MSLNSSNTPSSVSQVPEYSQNKKRPERPGQPWTWRRVGMIAGLVAWTFLAFALAQAIGYATIQALVWAGVPLQDIDETTFSTAANIAVYSLAIVLVIGVPRWIKKKRTTKQDLGLQRGPLVKDFLYLIVGTIGYFILTALVTSIAMALFPSADYQEAQDVGFNALANNWQYILAFVSLVVVAPVAEEVIFRGYLFGKLQKHAPLWLSVFLSAALFAVAHGQFNVALDTFALGVVLALLRVASGSLWPAILLHMLKNGIAFYFLFVNPLVL